MKAFYNSIITFLANLVKRSKVVGSFFNEKVNAGQAFGQRNMIFCIYVALTYTDPISSIVATLHMLVQNFYNSYQIIEYKKLDSGEIKNLYE